MPNINTGLPQKFENGGIAQIFNVAGTTGYDVLNIEPGTLRFQPGFNQKIVYKERGALVTTPLVGVEMPGSISFTARATKNGMTGATDLRTLARPADTTGYAQVFKVVIKVPDYRGAATGVSATLENCFMPEPPEYQASGEGDDFDKVTYTFTVLDPDVTIATY